MDTRPILARLKQARMDAGYSARQASVKLHMNIGVVNYYELGKRGLTLERFLELCELYGADVGEILGITARGTRTMTQDEFDDLTAAQRHLTRALKGMKGK